MAVVRVPASSAAGAAKGAQYEMMKLINDCIAAINGVNAKLDADAGVTDTDYASLHDVADTLAYQETGAPS